MDQLRGLIKNPGDLFTKMELVKIHQTAQEIAELGRFNFLFSDSKYLIAYNDHRDDDKLYYVLRQCKCGPENMDQNVAVVATNPTTDNEDWVKLKPDNMVVFYQGKVA